MGNQVVLTPAQAASYWWISRIMKIVRHSFIRQEDYTYEEIKFADIFATYTEKDWRRFYIFLALEIMTDVKTFELDKSFVGIPAFCQDTEKGYHNRLNEELRKILSKQIPDIRLAVKNSKTDNDFMNEVINEVIYTGKEGAFIISRPGGIKKVSLKYDDNYIISGNRKLLDFYNLVLATMACIQKTDSSFNSLEKFKRVFCREFKVLNETELTVTEVEEMFEGALKTAISREIIKKDDKGERYNSYVCEIDMAGLKEYEFFAKRYAKQILYKPSSNPASHKPTPLPNVNEADYIK